MKVKHRYDQEEYSKWLEAGADEDLDEITRIQEAQDADDEHERLRTQHEQTNKV